VIEGTLLKDLVVHKDERGRLFEILRSDSEIFDEFGQVYMTVAKPGWVKGWHYHKKQTDFFCVIGGKGRIVLFDRRPHSSTHGKVDEHVMTGDTPQLLVIPAGVVHGFETVGNTECWILNVPNKTYNRKSPDEFRIPLDSDEVPYEMWKGKKGW
jgi:dTDP-4-dehydrorhamnose 3,5-epimerase